MSCPEDPLNFIPADIFFNKQVPEFQQPTDVLTVESSGSSNNKDPLRYAALITLKGVNPDPNTYCLIQFVTPLIWRIRYDPTYTSLADFEQINTRTIVRDTFPELVDGLQDEYKKSEAWNSYPAGDEWSWNTTFQKISDDHWVLTSNECQDKNTNAVPKTNLHIFASPFRIVATRKLTNLEADPSFLKSVGIDSQAELEQIIWQTTDQTFTYGLNQDIDAIKNVVLNVKKPGPADYLGFGEQGGKTVLKKPTYLNYFCYDNFNYLKVYGEGALDNREPLYQSSPFYLEMNGTPSYRNVTGVMVDNYSQVAIDLGKSDSNIISIATRFNTFDAYIMTADDVPTMIWQYTSLVGRPKLKPRYILGHHQGCYGYAKEATVEGVVKSYRDSEIPLDGMHLDVDFQERYRTFTNSTVNFPNVSTFFSNLKDQGIKCCTNITPILTLRTADESSSYATLDEFWPSKDRTTPGSGHLVGDNRYLDGLESNIPTYWRYDGPQNENVPLAKGVNPTCYGNDYYGQPQRLSFADYPNGPVYTDDYNFEENYNTGYPFHGGVSYGQTLGTPGYYPDLNRSDARKLWGTQYQYLFDSGLEFVWQDMTTPAVGRSYGDMLGFPSRLKMTDDSPLGPPKTKTAIELWSLYSYNLHKATYNGLNNLKGRENKRNFIIGRGSQTGMHRFAGLWTGDNGSSWDFWKISIAQVLALGYSGLTIAGVDMGGFTSDPTSSDSYPRWCNPELLIRWYSGAFLLPWYRNHYMQHWDAESNPPAKVFQEPYAFSDVLNGNLAYMIPQDQRPLYQAVMPICRYYVQLRYSLMQVLYDYMFANLTNGLPIARAMLITDPYDTSLFNTNENFIDTQYLLGHNILVCPIVDPQVSSRDVYLPGTDVWYPSNLRVNNKNYEPDSILKHAASLEAPVQGGRIISYNCSLPAALNTPDNVPFLTPVYIRGGAIIPQIDVRQFIGENDLNPPTIHFYPGGKGTTHYSMYLDDGVSRDSAPADLPQTKYQNPSKPKRAKGFYREVKMTQESTKSARTLTIRHAWDGYDAKSTVGDTYNFAVWTRLTPGTIPSFHVSFQDENGNTVESPSLEPTYDDVRCVLTVSLPVALVPSLKSPGTSSKGTVKDRYIAVTITGLS